VNLEGYHVDDNRGDDEAGNAGSPVPKLVALRTLSSKKSEEAGGADQRHLDVTKLVPQVFYRVYADQGRHEQTNEFDATSGFSIQA
jgi:hypothetical protein